MNQLPENIKTVYFLGIGGIGMSALARYFKEKKCLVSGYDKTPSPITDKLLTEEIDVHFEDNPDFIPDEADLVIYTPAIPASNKEMQYVKEKQFPLMKRSEVLGCISKDKYTIAIAGSHGKTSITSMASLLFWEQKRLLSFIGGIALNFKSNFLYEADADCLIVEADEYDRSFLHLHPDTALISSMDADHLDIYETGQSMVDAFNRFANNIKSGGCLILKSDLLPRMHFAGKIYTYNLNNPANDFYASDIVIKEERYQFNIHTPTGIIENISFQTGGLHNVENAVAATALAWVQQLPFEWIKHNLSEYKGVKRRFEYIIRRDDLIYIDDYAHHPNELKAAIQSAKLLHPTRKICGIFQPHLYTRTRDFADDFARSLDLLDEIILLEIYPAREEPIEGVDAQMLLNKIKNPAKGILDKNELIPYLKSIHPNLIISFGAGDIDRLVEKIKTAFSL
ncbi:MAG TPA: UDP-N-acetylmuramate--L-alanine ligase [Bacteroidales bacterium]|jgi:UDP-N-acetylmuramate--alanine ligase|nr:UDP-N-acetylmuramate--L-alanine ligase [Bacteroidales bacterium]